MPWPEDSGGPAPPRHVGWARVAFGSVKTLGVRNKPFRSCTSTSGDAAPPTAYRILCLRFVHLVHRSHGSAMDARLDTGRWLALTRQGLSPCKRRQAFLGAITLGIRRGGKPEPSTARRRLYAVACRVEPVVTHPAPPQIRTCAIHAYGSSSRAAAAPRAVPWRPVVRVGELKVSPLSPASGCSARRRLPSRGSLGPHFPTFPGTMRRYDCHLPVSGASLVARLPDTLPASRVRGVPHGLMIEWKPSTTPGPLITRSPSPGIWSRRQVALPRSRVPPLETCPARRVEIRRAQP
jgi:hypothetical protein